MFDQLRETPAHFLLIDYGNWEKVMQIALCQKMPSRKFPPEEISKCLKLQANLIHDIFLRLFFNNPKLRFFSIHFYNLICSLPTVLSRGGTPLYGLYRYVRPQRVWFFSRFSHKSVGYRIKLILVINRV